MSTVDVELAELARKLTAGTGREHAEAMLPRRRGRVTRRWSLIRTGAVVHVATTHPEYGLLWRGSIHAIGAAGWRTMWLVQDQDWVELGRLAGDYLDAEAALLDGTGWADRIDNDGEG